MYKKFKQILIILFLIPCMLLLSACMDFSSTKDPGNGMQSSTSSGNTGTSSGNTGTSSGNTGTSSGNTGTNSGSSMSNQLMQAEAYTQLSTIISNYLTLDSINEQTALELEMNTTNIISSMNLSSTEKSKLYYGYNSDNTGYYASRIYNNETRKYETNEMFITKKSENDFLNYEYKKETSYNETTETRNIYLVDDEYAPNSYRITPNNENLEDVYDIFRYISLNNTLDLFKSNQNSIASIILGYPITENKNNDNSINIVKTSNHSTLTVSQKIDNVYYQLINNVNIEANLSINYNENDVVSLNIQRSIYGPSLGVKEINDYILTFDTSFNNSIMNLDTSEYSGTRYNGEIEKRKITCWTLENGYFGYDAVIGVYPKFGDEVQRNIRYDNATVELFWDKDLTRKIEDGDKYPSYDVKIYAKITPNEGYALVKQSADRVFIWNIASNVVSINEPFEYYYLNSDEYKIEEIKVNGVIVDPNDYEDGLILESGKIYDIFYKLSRIEES